MGARAGGVSGAPGGGRGGVGGGGGSGGGFEWMSGRGWLTVAWWVGMVEFHFN